jgi:hypothetical protein
MSEPNSVVEHQIRPDDLMAEFEIRKDTYYDDLKFLGIKAEKDDDGKAYLTADQANRVRALRAHVAKTGKRDGFLDSALAQVTEQTAPTRESGSLASAAEVPAGTDIQALIRAAAELKAQQLIMPELVKLELAESMSFEDFPEDLQQKVNSVREAANPKSQAAQIASQLLSQWRHHRQGEPVA